MDHTGVPSFLSKLKLRDKDLFEAVHMMMQKVMTPGKALAVVMASANLQFLSSADAAFED